MNNIIYFINKAEELYDQEEFQAAINTISKGVIQHSREVEFFPLAFNLRAKYYLVQGNLKESLRNSYLTIKYTNNSKQVEIAKTVIDYIENVLFRMKPLSTPNLNT